MAKLLAALMAIAVMCADAAAQGCGTNLADAQIIKAVDYLLAFRTEPAKIAIGKHFAIDLVVCPTGGAATPNGVTVDAYMPDHRHGMNYRPVVKALGGGRFHADGLMFHMPGRWEFRFDVERQGRTERLSTILVLR